MYCFHTWCLRNNDFGHKRISLTNYDDINPFAFLAYVFTYFTIKFKRIKNIKIVIITTTQTVKQKVCTIYIYYTIYILHIYSLFFNQKLHYHLTQWIISPIITVEILTDSLINANNYLFLMFNIQPCISTFTP